jgi:hypothetical protein
MALDDPYLRQWAADLGVSDLLENCLANVAPGTQE